MADKNKVVDDYYSNISENSSNKQEKGKKANSPVKKKIIIKKVNNQETKQEVDKKPSFKGVKVVKKSDKEEAKEDKKIDNKLKKKKIIQKITVENSSKPKKEIKTQPNDKNKQKKEDFKKVKVVKKSDKKEEPREQNKISKTSKDSNFEQKFDQKKNFKKNQKQNFNKNSKDEEESHRKNKSEKQKNKTRGKFRFPEIEEEVVFTRSKVQKNTKKEEKKVEDIKQNLVNKKGEKITIWDFIPVKELSEKIWIPFPKLIAEFMKNGMMVNINSKIDFESASIIAEAFEVKLERDVWAWVSTEDIFLWDISSFLHEDDSSKLTPRPPVISIMGHVDHWKTSLLDHIRKSKVAAWEAGWITQSIWAYQVELDSWVITFLDTPGHEAFTVMRARWAKSTDIAILVVAADEWVKPQTIESINHAKEADIPVIVAINKMDKEWANPDLVKSQLSEYWLIPEEWGWNTPMVPVSAHSWFWIDELLETILLVAELKELKANKDRMWVATVIESHLDSNLWPVATVLINTWTINSWDNIVCADSHWKVKILRNYANQKDKAQSRYAGSLCRFEIVQSGTCR